ncbi:MAG: hypothetical protein AAF667_17155 [Pseudomonadota bacterium]
MSTANPTAFPFIGFFQGQRTTDTTTGPKKRPYRGPVMMADILVAPGGRPALLAHWEDATDIDGDD